MLSIQYPLMYQSEFKEFCDFIVLDMSQDPSGMIIGDKPLWLDYSNVTFEEMEEHPRDAIILPQSKTEPNRYIAECARYIPTGNEEVIAIWGGDRSHLRMLNDIVGTVALPWWKHRNLVITPEEAYAYHAYEFSNLDELRRYPYRSLHTSVPITAAYMGIDLTDRERRPKRLPPFTYGMVLTEAQLELAYKNCQAIKEAMEYARRNNTLHT